MDIKILIYTTAFLALSCYVQCTDEAYNKSDFESEHRRVKRLVPMTAIAAITALAAAYPAIKDFFLWAQSKVNEAEQRKQEKAFLCRNRTIEFLDSITKIAVINELNFMKNRSENHLQLWYLRRDLFENAVHDHVLNFATTAIDWFTLFSEIQKLNVEGKLRTEHKLEAMRMMSDYLTDSTKDMYRLFHDNHTDKLLTRLLDPNIDIPENYRKCAAKSIFSTNPLGELNCVTKIKNDYEFISSRLEYLNVDTEAWYKKAKNNATTLEENFKNFLQNTQDLSLGFSKAVGLIGSFEHNDPGFLSLTIAGKVYDNNSDHCAKFIRKKPET